MNRALKFKAWDKEQHRMVCGGNFMIDATGCIFWQFGFDSPMPMPRKNWEVMQFTGLRDKNGVEIYEGDVLGSDEYPFCSDGLCNYRGEVDWWGEEGCWVLNLHVVSDRVRGSACGGNLSEYAAHCEVIGNTHENSELLETE